MTEYNQHYLFYTIYEDYKQQLVLLLMEHIMGFLLYKRMNPLPLLQVDDDLHQTQIFDNSVGRVRAHHQSHGVQKRWLYRQLQVDSL